jgi:hypothetical protein
MQERIYDNEAGDKKSIITDNFERLFIEGIQDFDRPGAPPCLPFADLYDNFLRCLKAVERSI